MRSTTRLLPAALLAAGLLAQPSTILVPLTKVTLEDRFWAPRIEVNHTRTLETVHQKLLESGNIQNFEIVVGKKQGRSRGPFWSDSDVYKWLEGVSHSLGIRPDPALEAKADEVIALLAAAQMPDGYLDTYFQLNGIEDRWTNLAFFHELFCAGHLFEAAVAHYDNTGKRTLLNVAAKFADHIDRTFGPGKRDGQPGHEEVELALVKLHRATGERRYLDLAAYFLNQRGRKPSIFETEYHRLDPSKKVEFLGRTITPRTLQDELFHVASGKFDTQYSQDHLPVRQQDKVVGHAVRAMYLYSGMADVGAATGDQGLAQALEKLYADLTTKRMYLTGGIGPSAKNEGFTFDYDLPNETAYQETCASIGVAMWTQRMFAMTGESRFADTMELALYNAFPAGVSLAGDRFFYDNPLYSAGKVERKAWFSVPCCPTNVARILPSMGSYIYAQSADGLWVNLYVQSRASARLPGGEEIAVRQQTDYPWSGAVKITLSKAPASDFALRLRVPGWAESPKFTLNGKPVQPQLEKGYAVIRRRWAANDVVSLDMPMPVERIEANPKVLENRGRVALRRGPMIYCLEQADQPADLDRLVLPPDPGFKTAFDPKLLGGVQVITAQALLKPAESWDEALYRPLRRPLEGPVQIRAIPYAVWANRGPGKMSVWLESR